MVRVLLVQPHDDIRLKKRKLDACTPLSLIFVGTAIEDYHDIKIFDRNLNTKDKYFLNFLKAYNPDIIGFTSMTSLMLLDLIHLAKLIRKFFPNKIILVGGIHATLEPESLLNTSYIDYIIRGEGEESFKEFCDVYAQNPLKLTTLKNINLNPLRPYVEMDTLKLPNYNLINLKNYEHFYVNISRGCPGNCTFCATTKCWGINGNPFVRSLSTEKSLSLFKNLIERYKIKTFEIVDDNFLSFKSRALTICNYLEKYSVNFWCFSRVDKIDDIILRSIKKAGCHTIQMGFESGSQRILDFLNKKVTVKQNIEAILCCKRNKIICDASFMIGLPTETIKEIIETKNLIKKYKPDIPNVKIFNPLPGAPLFDFCLKRGLLKPRTLEEWAIWTGDHRAVKHNVSELTDTDLTKIAHELWRVSYYQTRIKKFIFWCRKGNISNVFHGIRKFIISQGRLYPDK